MIKNNQNLNEIQKYFLILICLLPLMLIFSRAFSEFIVIIISFLVIFNLKKMSAFFLSKELRIDFFVIILFFIYLLINLFFTLNIHLSIERTLPFIRWVFFVIGVSYFFAFADIKKIDLFFKVFLIIMLIQSLYVIVDFSIIQIKQNSTIFGDLSADQSFIYRSNGFFSDNKSGSYISKFFLIPILWLVSKKTNDYKILSVFLIFSFAVFASGERASIFGFFITLVLVFLFLKNFRIKLLKVICLAALLFIILLTAAPHFKTRIVDSTLFLFGYTELIKDTNISEAYHNSGGDVLNKIDSFKDSQHGSHMLTAIQIWKNNKFFGSGLKTFRYMSSKKEFENIDSKNSHLRFANHPHNYYLEILSELGVFGIIIFLLLALRVFYNLLYFRDLKSRLFFYIAPSFLSFVFFWPLITTGSFFTNWISIIFWFLFAMTIGFKYRYNLKIDKKRLYPL